MKNKLKSAQSYTCCIKGNYVLSMKDDLAMTCPVILTLSIKPFTKEVIACRPSLC